MIFLNEQNKSILQKVLIIGCLVCSLFMAIYHDRSPLHLRLTLLIVSVLIYIVRLCLTFFLFLQRRLVLIETLTIAIVMSSILFIFISAGKANRQAFNIIDALGIFLYISGSFINTASEYLRFKWKSNPENKGHIYTNGFFKYSMHINYFGDVLLFLGFSILTGRFWTLIIPAGMLLNFMIFIIPGLDSYLSQKYGDEFIEYSKNTKKLIPFIY